LNVEEGHLPVMVEEVMEALSPTPGSFQIDATIGGGGHSLRILEAATPGGRLLGLDADAAAVERARRRLAPFGERATVVHSNFEAIAQVARTTGFDRVDGVLFDLGLSSHQLAGDERGFSFRADATLDMRFDPIRGVPARHLLATLDEAALTDLFRRYGEEPQARRIAREIVSQRSRAPIETTAQLATLVERVASGSPRGRRRLHPATRVFQALRIAVNRELDVLPVALEASLEVIKPDGRLVVIAYHSLEDRIVKRFMAAERRGCSCPPELPVCVCGRQPRLAPVGSQPRRPTQAEVRDNPRARSARLRVARRLAA
jgi:16S rRNA (cytosine1402-N4)-methyltransferase